MTTIVTNINDLSGGHYSVTKTKRWALFPLKGRINVEGDNDYKTRNKKLICTI